jgi:hypothetical protein
MRRVLLLATSLGLLGFVLGCHNCIHGVCDCDPCGLPCTGLVHPTCPGCPSWASGGGHIAPVSAASGAPAAVQPIRPEAIREMPKPADPDKTTDRKDEQ